MKDAIDRYPIAAWKCYTQWGPAGIGFELDSPDVGIPFIERARELGVRNICIHKGIFFAQFPQELGRNANVYAELGTTWRCVMRDPTTAAHLLGKLLEHIGEDNVLWGTDALWYGSPQDQIQAFRSFEIAPTLMDAHGYPELTATLKQKVFGLNGARVYGIDVPERLRKTESDPIGKRKQAYRAI